MDNFRDQLEQALTEAGVQVRWDEHHKKWVSDSLVCSFWVNREPGIQHPGRFIFAGYLKNEHGRLEWLYMDWEDPHACVRAARKRFEKTYCPTCHQEMK